MRIAQKLICGFVSVALLVGVVGYISLSQLRKIAEPLNKDIPETIGNINETSRLDGLAQFIRYYDEVLTQSARNYTFTKDKRWEKRYRDVEPKLDKIIKEAIGRGDKKDKEFFSSVDKANLALVEMEYKSIELVNNGRADEAVKILEGSEYWNQKEIYERGLRSYVRRRGTEYDKALLASTKTIDFATIKAQKLIKISTLLVSIFVIIALTLAVGVGLFVSHSISNPLAKLRAATGEMGKGKLDIKADIASKDEIGELAASFNEMAGKLKESHLRLKESHKQLEEKVQERTSELSSANENLEEEIAERTSAQKILEERIKELNCLFGLSKLVEQPGIPLEEILEETVDLIRNAYQEPDKTCVRITFEGMRYKTDSFEKSESSQHAPIKVHGEKAGDIEVYYLGEKAEGGEGPFLKEECDLLDAVAKHLGSIAERKQAGKKLQLFRNLIDRSNDSVFVIEPKWGRFLDVNDKACASLGYTREELLDMSLKDIDESIPDDSSWQEHLKELKLEGDIIMEGWHRRKDGTTFFVETSLKLVSQEKGERIIAIARDITERKQAEEALWESQERYRALVDNTILGITVMDTNHKVIMTNETFSKLFKKPAGYFVGKYCFREYEKRTAVCSHCPGVIAMASGKTAEVETQAVLDDGSRINVRNRAIPFFGSNGVVKGFIEIIENIDEHKKTKQRQDELLKEVESANRELKDFAYIVSHDLKAPLRGIKTLVDWISTDYADKLDEQGREQMNLLSSRVQRMHNLIDGVLQYSRVRREKEKRVRVNLNVLVSEVIEMVAPTENIEITVENEMPVVECGETRIMQVFQNLLSNAVKYTDKPQGRIKIGCVEEDGFWKFSVADNGPGIEEAHYEKIFQIFQTLSPRDEVESTGVGLSVVKKIVELYGGKIWVESKPGEGSTFFFTLPKPESEVADDAKLEANIVS